MGRVMHWVECVGNTQDRQHYHVREGRQSVKLIYSLSFRLLGYCCALDVPKALG